MLSALGITGLEEQVYRCLVGVNSASADDLAEALVVPDSAVRQALSALEARTIVSRTASEQPRFVAAPPDVVADRLNMHRQREIDEARAELGSLMNAYRQGRRVRGAGKVVEIISGPGLTARLLALQNHAKHELLGFVKPPFIAIDAKTAASNPLPVMSRPMRVIYEGGATHGSFVTEFLRTHQPGDMLRMHPALPTKLVIIDRELAVLPAAPDAQGATASTILVSPSGLLDAALALFEHYWESSPPLPLPGQPARPDWPSGEHQRVLALMLTGATDDVVARQLGISLRTVERRVKELMDEAGARTRLQLGWYARENAWVRSQDPGQL